MLEQKSSRFHLNKEDGVGILKTFVWTVATAIVVALISLNGSVEYPPELIALAPIVNTLLVAIHKALKDKGKLFTL